jgi:sulfide:quinone oxidoreductase
MFATVNDDVHFSNGPLVHIRPPRPIDRPGIERLLASPGASQVGDDRAPGLGALVADYTWADRIVGHAGWTRRPGSRAAATITVAREFARWPVAAHLLVRLARLADAALISTLVIATDAGDDELARVLEVGFGAERTPDGIELRTREWPAALACLWHPRAAALTEPAADEPVLRARAASGPVVIAGGGVAALECLMALRDLGGPETPIRLVSPGDAFVYRPLRVAEPFSLGRARRHPLAPIAADFGAELVNDAIVEVRPREHSVLCASGATLDYGTLVLAPGARTEPIYRHAITFGQDRAHESFHALLDDLEHGSVQAVAFVVPPETSWSLPLYELALMTAREASSKGLDSSFYLITPEQRPLAVFGPPVSHRVGGLLAAAGIEFIGSTYADPHEGSVRLDPGGRTLEVDAVVALPALRGPAIRGVPADASGFIPTDAYGRVTGVDDVFAAGDATTFPVKQGGIAAQQADAVAEAIAAARGSGAMPRPFRPVLRGLLFTGDEDRFLRSGIHGGEGDGTMAINSLWWPPTKVAGSYLAPYLFTRDFPGSAGEPPAGFTEVAVPLG